MREFASGKLGLTITLDQENAVVFGFPDGSAFEVFKPTDSDHSFFEHPVPGIIVDNVFEARAELEAKGVEFIGDVHEGVEYSWGTAWSHFRAPDGHVYVLISRPEMHPAESPRPFDELRICLAVSDIDEAVRVYRDGLGMPIVDEWTHPEGQRGVLFGVLPAAIELFDEAQWDFVDDSETGERFGADHALRVEVRDADRVEALARRLEASGATRNGTLTTTPWDQQCLRMGTSETEQLTLFTLPEAERVVREQARARLPY
ncbi:VOC family protein [Rhodococcus artemisiae]|uniref:VOC family protein n=1 Tax=Rhodococcus artemisiae TaxID=714159 RepID=A0ABU7LHI7_9NOCA|nr:VOC family protein [Rhodococcus artemisiae]MEE2060342.1 VOC family protein [Rhodococcus artemisiae]